MNLQTAVFPDDVSFSASDLNPPLLTINAPIGLSFRDNPGDIVNNSLANDGNGLEVATGNNISLLGGDVNFNGGNITVPSGVINLGGLSTAGTVTFDQDSNFSFPNDVAKANVSLTDNAVVNITSSGGGLITVNANNLELTEESQFLAGIGEGLGSENAVAGDIEIKANSLIVKNNAEITTQTQGEGDAGSITITINDAISLENSGGIRSLVEGGATGNGGDISLTSGELNLTNQTRIIADTAGQSTSEDDISSAGDIRIDVTGDINLDNGNQIQSQVRGDGVGNAGNITINTGGSLFSTNGNLILADSQATGNGGDITITAKEQIVLEGFQEQGFPSQIVAGLTRENAEGTGGNIVIDARELILKDVAFISSNTTRNSIGSAGDITLNVDSLRLSENAFVNVFTSNDFDSGSITINAQTLDLLSGGKILAATDGQGNAGNINLNISEQITIDNSTTSSARFVDFGENSQLLNDLQSFPSGIYANATVNATGNSGSIRIGMFPEQAPENFNINNAQIIVNSDGTGSGGNVFIRSNSLSLDGNATISASTAFGQGDNIGNINLEIAENLVLRDRSLISAEAINLADGGNIKIDANFIVAFPNGNNDIIANAQQGTGGNIQINAQSLFGIQERSLSDLTNDINASSEVDGLDGIVTITTPDINPLQGATELPRNVIEPQQTTAQACKAKQENVAQNGLTIKGKGGIPPKPTEPFIADPILVNGQTSTQKPQAHYPDIKSIKTSQGDIYPARGIIKTEDGGFILTAYPTDGIDTRTPQISANCS